MADYTITKISGNTALELHLALTESTNTSANTSTYTYRLYIKKIANSGYSYNTNNQAYLTIAGTAILATTSWGSINLSGLGIGGEFNLASGTTAAIAHNSDGSGSISVYAKFQQPNGTGAVHMEQTFSVTMTPIPRASKPTAANGIIGNTVTINTNRASSSFTHTIQYKIGSLGYTTIATGVGASVNWTLPASLADQITNASDGTVTINCITYSGSTQIGTATTTLGVTIPNSTLTCDTSGINMGVAKTIGVTNTCSSYLTVSVTASMGSVSRSVRTTFGSGSFTFDVATWAPAIPSAVSGTVTITQTTKRGTKTINTTTKTFTLTLPTGNRAPVLSAVNVSDPKGYAATYGYYLSGKSQIKVALTASASTGASLNYYSISIPGVGNYTSNGVTVDVPASLASDNAKNITAKVRDTRYSATQLEGSAGAVIKVLRYAAPTISATVTRSNSGGSADPSAGTYIRIKGSVSWTTITGGSNSNSISAKYRTRQQNGSWSGYTNLTLTNNAFDVTVGTFSYEYGWEVQIVATDAITTGGVTNSYTVGSAVFPIDVYPSQKAGIAFGKVSSLEGVVESAWPIQSSAGKMPLSAGKTSGLPTGTARVYGDGIAISNPATTNDQGWMRVLGTGEGDTVLEIATGDDAGAGEQIVVRQYNTSNAVARELKLFDTSGNTSVPGKLYTKTAFGYIGANSTYDVIKFKEGDEWGQGVIIGAGGLTVIGGGESANAVAATYSSGGEEVLALTSDQAVYVKTGVQNGAANAKTSTFYADGTLEIPNALHTGDVKYYGHVISGADGTANMWVCLGTLTSSGDSSNVIITLYTGDGYNANERQNTTLRIRIKDGYQSTHSTSSAFGASVTFEDSPNMAGNNIWATAVRVRATAYNVCQVWVKLPWGYYNGEYTVEGRYHDWVHSGARQSSEPTSGVSQSVNYYGSWGISTNTSGYIRFAQGAHKMQIAWKQVTVSTAWTSAWNSLWESSLIDCGGWAANFNARPASAAAAFGNGNTRGALFESNTGATETHAGKYYLVNTGKITDSASMVVTVIAVGSW